MLQVKPIPAFDDNYIWAIINSEKKLCVVVDPGQAEPVKQFLAAEQLQLSAIIITHHHWDHTNGVASLVTEYPNLTVYGPDDSPFKGITHPLNDQQTCTLACIDLRFEIITTPGHTLDHICYYSPQLNWLFSGDTLFSGGCGRLFEGTAEQMYSSLNRLKVLPSQTLVYCTHEYTLSNLKFAQAVEPNNQALFSYVQTVKEQRETNQCTLPSSIGLECAINPFLRADQPYLSQYIPSEYVAASQSSLDVFTALRCWKDHF
jgi:hydroxyacylglutathione hydrolase